MGTHLRLEPTNKVHLAVSPLRPGRGLSAIILALCAAACTRAGDTVGLTGPTTELGGLVVSDAEGLALVRALADPTGASFERLPGPLRANRRPAIAFVSLGAPEGGAAVVHAEAMGVVAAARAALARARQLRAGRATWIKLDLVAEHHPSQRVELDEVLLPRRSLAGVFIGRIGLLAEELVSANIVDGDGRLRPDRLRAYLRRRGDPVQLAKTVTMRRFRARSFFSDGKRAQVLYRGHPRQQPPAVTAIERALYGAGAYLTRSVDAAGKFAYSYRPKSDRVARDYNMVRHAGTVYSMFELWQAWPEPALRAAAERALGHLLKHIEPFPRAGPSARVLAHNGKIKLGGVALAAVALAKYTEATGDRRYLPVAQGLCRYIEHSQRRDGSFVHILRYPSGEKTDFRSRYYPGEALLALARVHALDGNERWMNVAARGAAYLIDVRDEGLATAELTHDHWLLYALDEIYRKRPMKRFLTHAMRIAQAIAGAQRKSPADPDHAGSFYDPPRSTPVATRVEGLMAALHLARDHARSMVGTIAAASGRGVRFMLVTQMTPPRAMYLPRPARALGGFTRSLTRFEIRIDYVQHNISALLAYLRWLRARG